MLQQPLVQFKNRLHIQVHQASLSQLRNLVWFRILLYRCLANNQAALQSLDHNERSSPTLDSQFLLTLHHRQTIREKMASRSIRPCGKVLTQQLGRKHKKQTKLGEEGKETISEMLKRNKLTRPEKLIPHHHPSRLQSRLLQPHM